MYVGEEDLAQNQNLLKHPKHARIRTGKVINIVMMETITEGVDGMEETVVVKRLRRIIAKLANV